MKAVHIPSNWNGSVLLDSFPIIRPATENLVINEEVEIIVKNDFAGYAKIVSGKIIKWNDINENISQVIIGNNTAYFKKVLTNVFHLSNNQPSNINFTLFFGFAKWIERNNDVHDQLFQSFYNKAKEKYKIYRNQTLQS